MDFITQAAKLGFKLYPRGENYLVYYYGKDWGIRTPRQIQKLLRKASKPMTKPRQRCWVLYPGCPCCEYSKSVVKKLNRKVQRQANKYREDRDNT